MLIMYDKTLKAFMEEATLHSTKQLKFPQPIADGIVAKTMCVIFTVIYDSST